jgi:hypothetical protein
MIKWQGQLQFILEGNKKGRERKGEEWKGSGEKEDTCLSLEVHTLSAGTQNMIVFDVLNAKELMQKL